MKSGLREGRLGGLPLTAARAWAAVPYPKATDGQGIMRRVEARPAPGLSPGRKGQRCPPGRDLSGPGDHLSPPRLGIRPVPAVSDRDPPRAPRAAGEVGRGHRPHGHRGARNQRQRAGPAAGHPHRPCSARRPRHGEAVSDHEDPQIVGRREGEIRLADREVSRRDAALTVHPGDCMIEDLQSTNGTFVNGARVTAAVLAHLDQLRLGRTRLLFSIVQEAGEAEGPGPAGEEQPAVAKRLLVIEGSDPSGASSSRPSRACSRSRWR